MPATYEFIHLGHVVSGSGLSRVPPSGVVPDGPVLAVVDPGLLDLGIVQPVLQGWRDAGLMVDVFSALESDPKGHQVDQARAAAHACGATTVLTVGGGSALDVGKTAAALLTSDDPAVAFGVGRQAYPGRTVALVAIPTTAGTGAEVTRTTIFSDDDGNKLWANDNTQRPDAAVLDPDLTAALPPGLTAATGLDALVHAIEACTNQRAHAMADAWALHAIRLVVQALPTAVRDPTDLQARSTLLNAACLAGLAIDACGTAVAHAMGHALGSIARVHHGRAVALSLRVALAGNAAASPARHAAVARAMGLIGDDDPQVAAGLSSRFDAFLRQVGLPITLADDGLGPDDAERLAVASQRPENQPMLDVNCRVIEPAGVLELSRAVLVAD